jgi:hypothetical protein
MSNLKRTNLSHKDYFFTNIANLTVTYLKLFKSYNSKMGVIQMSGRMSLARKLLSI